MRFGIDFVIFFVIMAASTVPRFLVARHVERHHSHRNWLVGAVIMAAAGAAVGVSSRDLVKSCLAEYDTGCADAGGAGWQLMFIAGYIIVALVSAYLMSND